MKHLGDITKMHGDAIPAVDVITGGSPCQDLSVAGKRAGLAGERSGLFMEQIRVIKEMRQRDRDNGRTGKLIRPRYMVWENVPGAFSSNGDIQYRQKRSRFGKLYTFVFTRSTKGGRPCQMKNSNRQSHGLKTD